MCGCIGMKLCYFMLRPQLCALWGKLMQESGVFGRIPVTEICWFSKLFCTCVLSTCCTKITVLNARHTWRTIIIKSPFVNSGEKRKSRCVCGQCLTECVHVHHSHICHSSAKVSMQRDTRVIHPVLSLFWFQTWKGYAFPDIPFGLTVSSVLSLRSANVLVLTSSTARAAQSKRSGGLWNHPELTVKLKNFFF